MDAPYRLIIADDHALFRQGLKSLLEAQPDVVVVAEVDNLDALEPTLDSTPCDVLLLDLQMERWALEDIESLARRVTVVVVTASESLEDAANAMRMGARAIVQKRFAVEMLMVAIRAAVSGMVWMPPALQAELASQAGIHNSRRLTMREAEIVRYVSTGLRNAEVADRLSITEGTVKTHLNNIFQKLGIRDRVELTNYALRGGFLTLRERGRS
jgi:two-component system NarL family response regulator